MTVLGHYVLKMECPIVGDAQWNRAKWTRMLNPLVSGLWPGLSRAIISGVVGV